MALIQCVECATQISDQATVCPKCGAPRKVVVIKPAKKRTSFGALLLVAVSIVVGAGVLMKLTGFEPPTATQSEARKRWTPSADDISKQPARKKLIDKLGNQGLWSKIEHCETVDICVFVRLPFYGMDFDMRQGHVELVWTYYAVDTKFEIIRVHVMDAKTGKEVGLFDRGKLTMH